MATDEEVLASVKRGKPPVDCAVIGTWQLRSYVRERLSDGQRHNQFGEAPVGYIGYAPDGRMYASKPGHSCSICVAKRPSEIRMSRPGATIRTEESPVNPVK